MFGGLLKTTLNIVTAPITVTLAVAKDTYGVLSDGDTDSMNRLIDKGIEDAEEIFE